MANAKISALTSATTPLAGTEVLPIVQSGSTVKVANNDLRPKQIQSNATSGVLQIAGPSAASTRVMTTPDANFTAARTDAAQSFTGDQTLSTGNLIQGTAAKGINFTANTPAAGKTSQLLNWYEEGTWTPSLKFGGAAVGMIGSYTGRYTRTGRMVYAYASITLTTKGVSTGYASVTGFPFSSADACSCVVDPVADLTGLTAGGSTFLTISAAEGYLLIQTTTGRTTLSETNFTNTTTIRFAIVYNV
jgi:hypothetical protein